MTLTTTVTTIARTQTQLSIEKKEFNVFVCCLDWQCVCGLFLNRSTKQKRLHGPKLCCILQSKYLSSLSVVKPSQRSSSSMNKYFTSKRWQKRMNEVKSPQNRLIVEMFFYSIFHFGIFFCMLWGGHLLR